MVLFVRSVDCLIGERTERSVATRKRASYSAATLSTCHSAVSLIDTCHSLLIAVLVVFLQIAIMDFCGSHRG